MKETIKRTVQEVRRYIYAEGLGGQPGGESGEGGGRAAGAGGVV